MPPQASLEDKEEIVSSKTPSATAAAPAVPEPVAKSKAGVERSEGERAFGTEARLLAIRGAP